jgi:hypothetical protein
MLHTYIQTYTRTTDQASIYLLLLRESENISVHKLPAALVNLNCEKQIQSEGCREGCIRIGIILLHTYRNACEPRLRKKKQMRMMSWNIRSLFWEIWLRIRSEPEYEANQNMKRTRIWSEPEYEANQNIAERDARSQVLYQIHLLDTTISRTTRTHLSISSASKQYQNECSSEIQFGVCNTHFYRHISGNFHDFIDQQKNLTNCLSMSCCVCLECVLLLRRKRRAAQVCGDVCDTCMRV